MRVNNERLSLTTGLGLLLLLLCACDRKSDERLARVESRLSQLEAKLSDLEKPPVVEKAPAAITPTPTPLASDAITETVYPLSGNEKDDPFLGSSSAPLLFMAFVDFQSASTRRFVETTLPALREIELQPDGPLKFLLRDFPLSTEESSLLPAITAHCLGEQGKYWKFFDAFFSSDLESALAALPELNKEKLAKCRNSNRYYLEIERDIQDGRALGAKGAPSFFLGKCSAKECRGKFIRGAQPVGVFRKVIQELSSSTAEPG